MACCVRSTNPFPMDRRKNHTIEIMVDRILGQTREFPRRLEQSHHHRSETCQWTRHNFHRRRRRRRTFSEKLACQDCGISVPQLGTALLPVLILPTARVRLATDSAQNMNSIPQKVIVDWSKPLFQERARPRRKFQFRAAHHQTLASYAHGFNLGIYHFESQPKRSSEHDSPRLSHQREKKNVPRRPIAVP